MARLLLTGCDGLIGRSLRLSLLRLGYGVVGLDNALPRNHPEHGDVRDAASLAERARDCHGIVHLAAIARVGASEADPMLAWEVNVGAVETVLEVARRLPQRPWVLLASSREVYGEPTILPVVETAAHAPINVYGRSKAAAERLVEAARARGQATQIIRYANVYGSIDDHPDRVVPAFTRAAATGALMHVRGADNAFDFTHVDDVAAGTARLVQALLVGARDWPPIQLVTGRPTRLGELARAARRLGGNAARLVEEASVDGTVARFWGDPTRARQLLHWRPMVELETGLRRMVEAFAQVERRDRSMVA